LLSELRLAVRSALFHPSIYYTYSTTFVEDGAKTGSTDTPLTPTPGGRVLPAHTSHKFCKGFYSMLISYADKLCW